MSSLRLVTSEFVTTVAASPALELGVPIANTSWSAALSQPNYVSQGRFTDFYSIGGSRLSVEDVPARHLPRDDLFTETVGDAWMPHPMASQVMGHRPASETFGRHLLTAGTVATYVSAYVRVKGVRDTLDLLSKTKPDVGLIQALHRAASLLKGGHSFKADILGVGDALTPEMVMEYFLEVYPEERSMRDKIASVPVDENGNILSSAPLNDHRFGYAVYNPDTMHAVLVRAGKFVAKTYDVVDDHYTGFVYGRTPDRSKLETLRWAVHSQAHADLVNKAANALRTGADHCVGGSSLLGLEIEAKALTPDGKPLNLSTTRRGAQTLVELGADMIEVDTGTLGAETIHEIDPMTGKKKDTGIRASSPLGVLVSMARTQSSMMQIALTHYWEEQVRRGVSLDALQAPLMTVVSGTISYRSDEAIANTSTHAKYGAYVGLFEGYIRHELAVRGPYARQVWDQIAIAHSFANIDTMMQDFRDKPMCWMWDPDAFQVNYGLPNLWVPDTDLVSRVANYLADRFRISALRRGRYEVSAELVRNMGNLLFSQWVIGITGMMTASTPWLRGIVPNVGEEASAAYSRETRPFQQYTINTAWGMNRAYRTVQDMLRTVVENMVMGRVDRVARAIIRHDVEGTTTFPDGANTQISQGKVSVHGGGRVRAETHPEVRTGLGRLLFGRLKGDFSKPKGRMEVTRPNAADSLQTSRAAILAQFFGDLATMKTDDGDESLRYVAELAGIPNAREADLDELLGDGDALALLFYINGADHPKVRQYLDRLERIIQSVGDKGMAEKQAVALAAIQALRADTNGNPVSLAQYARDGVGTMGGAMRTEFMTGRITNPALAARVTSHFQMLQRHHIERLWHQMVRDLWAHRITDPQKSQLWAYLTGMPGSGFVYNAEDYFPELRRVEAIGLTAQADTQGDGDEGDRQEASA